MKKLWLSIAILSSAISVTHAGDCIKAQQEYEKGLNAGKTNDWEAAKSALLNSTAECNTFNNWYLLAQVYQTTGKFDDALLAYEDAQQYSKNPDERALTIARYAEVQSQQGEVERPLSLIHAARKMHSNPPAWMTELAYKLDEKRLEQPLTIAQVTRALTNRSIKLLNVDSKPNINVNINFKYNSTDLIDASYAALDVLAEALANDAIEKKPVTIVGHSDERGSEDFNINLSKERAVKIKQELIARNPTLSGRLDVIGKGETAPLYTGKTEKDYMLNRRIELEIE